MGYSVGCSPNGDDEQAGLNLADHNGKGLSVRRDSALKLELALLLRGRLRCGPNGVLDVSGLNVRVVRLFLRMLGRMTRP